MLLGAALRRLSCPKCFRTITTRTWVQVKIHWLFLRRYLCPLAFQQGSCPLLNSLVSSPSPVSRAPPSSPCPSCTPKKAILNKWRRDWKAMRRRSKVQKKIVSLIWSTISSPSSVIGKNQRKLSYNALTLSALKTARRKN